MTMAISLWQPWATAIAKKAKRIETRSWKTDYRGEIYIHAAKHKTAEQLIDCGTDLMWRAALGLADETLNLSTIIQDMDELLPFGALVAKAHLIDCRPTASFTIGEVETPRGKSPHTWCERHLGDFSIGRWGWVLSQIEEIEPIPCKGQRGLFHVNPIVD